MLHTHISSEAELAIARAEVVVTLTDLGFAADHIHDVEVVADELLGHAMEAGVTSVQLFVESLERVTRVRVRCERYVDRDPVGTVDLRDRVLLALAVSVGRERNIFGTSDVWADVERPG
jgi:hypothetical protein